MKRVFNLVAFLFAVFVVSGCSGDESVEKPDLQEEPAAANLSDAAAPNASETAAAKVSVMGLDTLMTDRLLEHLTRSKRFIPLEREALRKVVEEQRFGTDRPEDFVSKTLEKAIQDMEAVGAETVEAVGSLAKSKDVEEDLKDLGEAVGADYLIVAKLEKIEHRKPTETALPYSTEGRTITKLTSDARLRFRVVDVESGSIVGAASLRSKLTENAFAGRELDSDDLTFIDRLCAEAAEKIIDVTFPAAIVSLEPLVVSRGSNEGARVGDRYLVKRKGEEMKDAGDIPIGRLLSSVGVVELSGIDETFSTAETVSGGPFVVGDLAVPEPASEPLGDTTPTSAQAPIAVDWTASGELPRLAVGRIKFSATGDEASESVSLFTDAIISGLSATRRFQLVDRQEVDQLLMEQIAQALAAGRDMPSPMGTLKGADYLVYGNVDLFDVQDEVIRLPNSSRRFAQKIGRVNGNVRVVDARSGDILVSRSVEIEQDMAASTKHDRVVTTLAKAYSDELVEILLNAIYPLRVVSLGADGTVYINRGRDGGLSQEETLEVFRPGPAVIDPDSGAQLGVQESRVGSVKIVSVEEARSRAVSTPGSDPRLGDILRRGEGPTGMRRAGDMPRQGSEEARPTLAIGLVRPSRTGRIQHSQRTYLADLPADLMIRLSNTGRFDVLERQSVDQLLDEKAFQAALSGENMSRYLRDLSGADYLVYGEVTDFYVDIERQRIEVLDEVEQRATGVANFVVRVVDVPTGAVSAADKIMIHQPLAGDGAFGAQLLELLSTAAVSRILERLYPVRVIAVIDAETVYLNRGEDGDLTVGALFDVMRPGPKMVDPDTGISFGAAETKVAVLEVASVEASRSRATLVSGGPPRIGDVARQQAQSAETVEAKRKQREFDKPSF